MRPPHDHISRLFHDLFTLLRSPPHDSLFSVYSKITPAGFASLMLGMSLIALMFCGFVTFFIGFMLMPWVLGLVMFLYVTGIISSLSFLGRSIICFATGPHPSPKHNMDIPSWKLL